MPLPAVTASCSAVRLLARFSTARTSTNRPKEAPSGAKTASAAAVIPGIEGLALSAVTARLAAAAKETFDTALISRAKRVLRHPAEPLS